MGRVVLEDLLNLLTGPDIIRIKQKDDDSLCYEGYWGILRDHKHVAAEIRHKNWKELGLAAPMMPEEQAQYNFMDMQVNIIHEIWI